MSLHELMLREVMRIAAMEWQYITTTQARVMLSTRR